MFVLRLMRQCADKFRVNVRGPALLWPLLLAMIAHSNGGVPHAVGTPLS